MSNESIPLAKGFKPEKLVYPAYISKKEDGVPVRFTISRTVDNKFGKKYSIIAQTRQGKPVPSLGDDLDTILRIFTQRADLNKTLEVVAEITHVKLTNFKDISGLVRKQTPQEGLVYNFFDFSFEPHDKPFRERKDNLRWFLKDAPYRFKCILQMPVFGPIGLDQTVKTLLHKNPDWEGLVARSADATFKPATRHWDYQKIVIDPSIDLRIIDVEEAIDQHGEPKGMVGRLVAEYKGNKIGIGPGKLTHKERTQLWEDYNRSLTVDNYPNCVATIKYKRDDSYEALRQPTFQHWRPEKTEESYE